MLEKKIPRVGVAVFVSFILDRDAFRSNFNSQNRLEYAILGIKLRIKASLPEKRGKNVQSRV